MPFHPHVRLGPYPSLSSSLSTHALQGVYSAARLFFCLFQHHSLPDRVVEDNKVEPEAHRVSQHGTKGSW